VRTLEPLLRFKPKKKVFQKILFDKVYNDSKDLNNYAVGIVSPEVGYYPERVIERAIGFKGGAVFAVDLNPGKDEQTPDVEMMSSKEAQDGFVVLSVILHKRTLSWLVASSKKR
jgi:C4-dicarboxylate-specific signal transduction histidine kinase